MGWLGLLLMFGSLAVIDQLSFFIQNFIMKFYLFTKHKIKVKVRIILSEAQTTQKRDDILKKSS